MMMVIVLLVGGQTSEPKRKSKLEKQGQLVISMTIVIGLA